MKRIVVVGAGTAGTTVANLLRKRLSEREWAITVLDRDDRHVYQPGLLFVPFGLAKGPRLVRPRRRFLRRGIDYRVAEVAAIDPARREVATGEGRLAYDWLVLATGCRIAPEETPGLEAEWGRRAFTFYTPEGAEALRPAFDRFEGGRLLVCVAELPFKCPVAPIEFAFLADWALRERGLRGRAEIHLATPFPQCMPNWPKGREVMIGAARERGIELHTGYALAEVDGEAGCVRDFGGEEIPYDLLVIVPPNTGDPVIAASGLDDGSTYVPTHPKTLKAQEHDRIYCLGDATNLPTSKAGSVAHYEAEVAAENLVAEIEGREPEPVYDGHSTCFIVSRKGRAYLVDFNYETEPLFGKFPLPGLGPFSLLAETRANWYGKLGFEWLYWNVILPGRPTPRP
ncbi:MAG: NAD(P)/FAD-dependent oxidoreductase, partial [Nitrospirae bacterium]